MGGTSAGRLRVPRSARFGRPACARPGGGGPETAEVDRGPKRWRTRVGRAAGVLAHLVLGVRMTPLFTPTTVPEPAAGSRRRYVAHRRPRPSPPARHVAKPVRVEPAPASGGGPQRRHESGCQRRHLCGQVVSRRHASIRRPLRCELPVSPATSSPCEKHQTSRQTAPVGPEGRDAQTQVRPGHAHGRGRDRPGPRARRPARAGRPVRRARVDGPGRHRHHRLAERRLPGGPFRRGPPLRRGAGPGQHRADRVHAAGQRHTGRGGVGRGRLHRPAQPR